MKPRKKLAVASLAAAAAYIGIYCLLRTTKYFVRQEFICFSCSGSAARYVREKYPDDPGKTREGHTSYGCESERNQIGCGRIQKDTPRLGEHILIPAFRPLGELEMRIRGFDTATMYVYRYVSEFERYNASSNKVYFPRMSLADKFPVSRRDQVR